MKYEEVVGEAFLFAKAIAGKITIREVRDRFIIEAVNDIDNLKSPPKQWMWEAVESASHTPQGPRELWGSYMFEQDI